MVNYTTATIEGNVTHSPEYRKTKTGKSLCTFSLAVNHYSNEQEKPKVSYIDVETWEKVADLCSSKVSKGRRLLIIGRLRQDRWEDKDGKIRSRIKIVGNEVRFLESPKRQEEAKEAV